jgi:hypothetical protein
MLPAWQQWKPGWTPAWQGGQGGTPGLIPWDALTFTRAGTKYKEPGDGTATLAAANVPIIDARGLLIEPAIINLIFPSQAFQTWVLSDATETPDTVVAPDGTLTADVLTASQNTVAGGATAILYQGFGTTVVGQQYTLSVWAKSGTFDKLDIACNNGSTVARVSFQLTSQWARYSATFTAQATFIYAEVGWLDTYSVSGKNVHIWGYQAEAGLVAHSYVSTTSAAVTCPKDVAYFSGLSIPSASRISGNFTPRTAMADGNYHFLFDTRDRATGIGGCALFVEPTGAMTARIQDTGVDVTLFGTAVLPWVARQTYAISLVQDGLGNASIIRDGVTVGSATAQRILPVATYMTLGGANDSTLPWDGWIANPALRPALTPF